MLLLTSVALLGALVGGVGVRSVMVHRSGARDAAVRSLLGHLAAIEASTRRLEDRVSVFEGHVVEQARRIQQLAGENQELRAALSTQTARCESCVNFNRH